MADDMIEHIRAEFVIHPGSTHYQACWQHHEECAIAVLLDEIERLRAVVDALIARPFRGTSLERRDRMYGSDWEAVHDALDAWQEARRG